MNADTSIRLKTKDGRVVYPHETVLADSNGRKYLLDSWEPSGAVFVVPQGVGPKRGFRQRMRAEDFGLTIEKVTEDDDTYPDGWARAKGEGYCL